jgi:HTH-type transcriptional regulator/antitoxin HigA
MLRIIDSLAEYNVRLAELDSLLTAEPLAGSPTADRVKLLAVLLERFEDEHLGPATTDPIAAIEFRMEQLNLGPRDLEPYLGSRSKVSEILSGKRSLTRAMAQALHHGLGIPAEALLSQEDGLNADASTDWTRFPIREMVKRGWLTLKTAMPTNAPEIRSVLEPYFLFGGANQLTPALLRTGSHVRTGRAPDPYALTAWTARVMHRASEAPARTPQPLEFSAEWTRDFVRLSTADDAIVRVRSMLRERGVLLLVEPHLNRTRLDGAALLAPNGWAVIALTLRFDRIDHFWFTLLHELAHLLLHTRAIASSAATIIETVRFFDDLDAPGGTDPIEVEADDFAREALVPRAQWDQSAVAFTPSTESVALLARDLQIHPAIVAGRARHEFHDFRMLKNLVGHDAILNQYPDIASWSAIP